MVHLPFDLSIDFESRQAMESSRQLDVEEGVAGGQGLTNVTETTPINDQSSFLSPLRPIVVVKTHAATGQRSTAGNVKSAVWDTSPLHASARGQATQEETDSEGQLSSISALKQLQEKNSPTRTPISETPPTQTQAPPTNKTSQRNTGKKQGPWWKKFSDSLMELNMGGAITGPPKNLKQQQQQKPSQPPPTHDTNERRVKALYNNIGDDADELTFSKDDILIVKDQINEEWLICTTGSRSGIVPVSYVQPLF